MPPPIDLSDLIYIIKLSFCRLKKLISADYLMITIVENYKQFRFIFQFFFQVRCIQKAGQDSDRDLLYLTLLFTGHCNCIKRCKSGWQGFHPRPFSGFIACFPVFHDFLACFCSGRKQIDMILLSRWIIRLPEKSG
jgi:hypothetical protein